MANDSENLNLGTTFSGDPSGLLNALNKVEATLKSLVKSIEQSGTVNKKFTDDLNKNFSQLKTNFDNVNKTAENYAKSLAGISGVQDKYVKTTASSIKATDAQIEALQKYINSTKEGLKALNMFTAEQSRSVYMSGVSAKQYNSLVKAGEQFRFSTQSVRNALFEMWQESGRNTTRFEQLAGKLKQVEGVIQTSAKAMKDAGVMSARQAEAWANGVDRVAMSHKFLNKEVFASQGVVMQAEGGWKGYQNAVSKVSENFKELMTSSTSFGNEARALERQVRTTGEGFNTYAQQLTNLNKGLIEHQKGVASWNVESAKMQDSLKSINGHFKELFKSQDEYGEKATALRQNVVMTKEGLNEYKQALTQVAKEQKEHSKAMEASEKAATTLGQKQEWLATKYKNVIASGTEFGKKVESIIKNMTDSGHSFDMAKLKCAELEKEWQKQTTSIGRWNTAVQNALAYSEKTSTAIASLNEKIKAGTITHEQATKSLNETVKSMKSAGTTAVQSSGFFAGLTGKLTGMGSAANLASDFITTLGRAVGSLAAWIPAAMIIGGFTTAITEAISSIKEFDQALKSLQAISGGTEAEISSLGDKILEISSSTKYSAEEIGKGAIYIAQAGFSASESLFVIEAAAKGAQGTLEGLNVASDLLTTVIRAFELEARNASVYMDALAMAANKSKTNLEGMQIAFNYIGPVAKAVGLDLQQTLGILMTLANQGMRMSTIGTGMRQVFITLSKEGGRLGVALEKAGLSADALNIKAHGLNTVLDNLNILIGGDFGKAATLFTQRAAGAALIMASFKEQIKIMIEETRKFGAASAMADIQTEGLGNQLSMVNNKFKNLMIELSRGDLVDIFKKVIGVISTVLSVLTALAENGFVKFAIAVGTVTVAVQLVIRAFQSLMAVSLAHYFGVGLQTMKLMISELGVMGVVSIRGAQILEMYRTALIAMNGASVVAAGGVSFLGKMMAWLNVLIQLNPFTKLLTILVALGVGFYAVSQRAENLSRDLQKASLQYKANSETALQLANSLDEINKSQKDSATTSDNYLAILNQIKKTFPDLTLEILKNKDSLEAQIKLLNDRAAALQKQSDATALEAVKALAEQYKVSSDNLKEYNKYMYEGAGGFRALIGGLAGLIVILPAYAAHLVTLGGRADAVADATTKLKIAWAFLTGTLNEAVGKGYALELAKQNQIWRDTVPLVINSSKEMRESLLKAIPAGEYRDYVKGMVDANDRYMESLKKSMTPAMQKQMDMLAELGPAWQEYYSKLDKADQQSFFVFALNTQKKAKAAYDSAYKINKDVNEALLAKQKVIDDAFAKEIESQEKKDAEVLKLIQKVGEEKKKLWNAEIAVKQQSLENQLKLETAKLEQSNLEESVFLAEKAKIEEDYYAKSQTLIEEDTKKRLDSQQKLYDGYLAYINIRYKNDSETLQRKEVEAEIWNAEQIAGIWKGSLDKWKQHIDDMASKAKKYHDEYLNAIKKIAEAEDYLSKQKKDLEAIKRDALRLTMTEEEKAKDKVLEFNEIMKKGYEALAEAEKTSDETVKKEKLRLAKEYFESAKGMIGDLGTYNRDAEGKLQSDAEATSKLRIAKANEVGEAMDKLTQTTTTGYKTQAETAKAKEAEIVNAMDEAIKKYEEMKTKFAEAIKISLDTTETYAHLDKLLGFLSSEETKNKFKIVLKFLGEASPADTLSNTIASIKTKLEELKTSLIDEKNRMELVFYFMGTINTADKKNFSLALEDLKTKLNEFKTTLTDEKSRIEAIIYFMGVIGGEEGKSNILTAIEAIKTKLLELKTSITAEENKIESVISFLGNIDGVTNEALINAIQKVITKIGELKASLTTEENKMQSIISFLGNIDGSSSVPLITAIQAVIEKINELKLLLSDEANKPKLVISILGSTDGSNAVGISTAVESTKTLLSSIKETVKDGVKFLIKIIGNSSGSGENPFDSVLSSVKQSLINFATGIKNATMIVLFYGNSGGGVGWLDTVTANVLKAQQQLSAQINALKTVHTIVTQYVTAAAGGGKIDGTGDSDTVPAMLTPGEFVIRKSVVNKLGEGFFNALNSGYLTLKKGVQKFASGGSVEFPAETWDTYDGTTSIGRGATTGTYSAGNSGGGSRTTVVAQWNSVKNFSNSVNKMRTNLNVDFTGTDGGNRSSLSSTLSTMTSKVNSFAKSISTRVQEIVALGNEAAMRMEAMRIATNNYSITEYIKRRNYYNFVGFDEGGSVPGTGNSDTVPAKLTPGEFVIQKSVVSMLGEGFFNMLNNVKNPNIPKFNAGGFVQYMGLGGKIAENLRHTEEVFTVNLTLGDTNYPLKVVGNPNMVRNQLKSLEKELSRMRLSYAK